MVAGVGLAVRVYHVVLVQAGVLSEAFATARYSAHVWLLSCSKEGEKLINFDVLHAIIKGGKGGSTDMDLMCGTVSVCINVP